MKLLYYTALAVATLQAVSGLCDPRLISAKVAKHNLGILEAADSAPSFVQQDVDGLYPQQIHTAFGTYLSELSVSFVTMNYSTGSVRFVGGDSDQTYTTTESTYDVGNAGGWTGWIHQAIVINLQLGTVYEYYVSSSNTTVGPLTIKTPPAPNGEAPSYVAVIADMGTFVPLGYLVADALHADHVNGSGPFDFVLHAGDVAYAGMGSQSEGEWEPIWDWFGNQIQAVTGNTDALSLPWMTTVGNHESYYNYTAFLNRYFMPGNVSGGTQNFWFSFDYGNVHYTSMSSEHPYTPGTPQYNWLKADLLAAASPARRSLTPWIVVSLHRPIFSSDSDEYNTHCPGAPLPTALEPVFEAASVDLVITGHVHMYERMQAIRNGTVITAAGPNNTYMDPGAPVYIVQGTSGALQIETFVDPQPAWSAFRVQYEYGYGRLRVYNSTHLDYDFVNTNGTQIDYFSITKAPQPSSHMQLEMDRMAAVAR